MNDFLVMHIENHIFKTISYEKIMQRSQNIKTCRRQLNKLTLREKINCKLYLYVLDNN
jgi:hypothetical protein